MKLTLTSKIHLADNVWSFTFTPKMPLDWVAGQFVKVALAHPSPDSEGISRFFTIAAAPYEQLLTISTRVTDSTFKQALSKLSIGGTIDLLDTPAGDFVWHSSERERIFVAQGIGITPFYAIIKDRIHCGLPVQAKLIYANRPGHAALFEAQLREWAQIDPTFQMSLQNEFITPAAVASLTPDLASHTVYVSGPKSLMSLCLPPYNLPVSQFKQDNFPGYAAANY